jgi:hypothetical protein
MKPAFDLYGIAPQVMTTKDGKNFTIQWESVEQTPSGPRRTEKYIHLSMTAADAMRLLGLLEGARQTHGLPVQANVTQLDVPPLKDRN